ncbi:DUF6265 family protein [Myxococcus sp. K15C18031901]|uniref:DUF6265 family protein n=1 Tax=Myxococcus dinghuensis TaxID=2906761 RepID=UPI0020A7E0E6|nr:DUF6265 family protein [Myxococcus dinghuensis]MCP3103440.1 DUF6265 family protein [Myxococcus dinghuensis]
MYRRLPILSLLSLSLCGAALPGCKSTPTTPDDVSTNACGRSVADLAWLSGDWVQRTVVSTTEEHWSSEAGNSLLGTSRVITRGKAVFFEYMRIEGRDDGLYYVAQPMGRAPTDFKLVRCSGREALFENPGHDFPQRILYRRESGGRLVARIEGDKDGKVVAEDFDFTRD